MTTDDLIAYYSSLLLLQYKGQPKAVATIRAVAKMFVMDQLPTQVMNAYTVEGAVGVQLDVIGKYAGVTRNGYTFVDPITLSDDDFRIVIKLAILENNAGSSLSDIQDLIALFFPGILFIFDYLNMRISYFMNSSGGSTQLAQFFVKQGSLPRPMGVTLSALIYFPTTDNFFGFRTYQAAGVNNTPFNTYDDYSFASPWLSYAYAIIE